MPPYVFSWSHRLHFACEGLIHGTDLTVEPSLIQPIGRRPELMQKIVKPKRNKSSCTDRWGAVLVGSARTYAERVLSPYEVTNEVWSGAARGFATTEEISAACPAHANESPAQSATARYQHLFLDDSGAKMLPGWFQFCL